MAAPYLQTSRSAGYMIDPASGSVLFGSAGWIRAMQVWQALAELSPPEDAHNCIATTSDSFDHFAAGTCMMTFNHIEFFKVRWLGLGWGEKWEKEEEGCMWWTGYRQRLCLAGRGRHASGRVGDGGCMGTGGCEILPTRGQQAGALRKLCQVPLMPEYTHAGAVLRGAWRIAGAALQPGRGTGARQRRGAQPHKRPASGL